MKNAIIANEQLGYYFILIAPLADTLTKASNLKNCWILKINSFQDY
jgi:hypothetical protein